MLDLNDKKARKQWAKKMKKQFKKLKRKEIKKLYRFEVKFVYYFDKDNKKYYISYGWVWAKDRELAIKELRRRYCLPQGQDFVYDKLIKCGTKQSDDIDWDFQQTDMKHCKKWQEAIDTKEV